MKKARLTLLLLCTAMFFISCNKEKDNSDKATTPEPQQQNVKSVKKETISSVVIYDGTPLYIEDSDGKMVYADEALLGDTIRVYVEENSIEQKEAIRLLSNGKEDTFNFVHVNYYDSDYWTRDIFITNNSKLKPGIITTDSLTYSAPDGTSATSKKLEAGTVVAIDPDSTKKDSDLDIDFISVTYYNGAAFGKPVYVKAEVLSDTPADIIANQTISRIIANDSLKPEIADILFLYIESMEVSSYMQEKIQAAKEEVLNRRN